jgi:hypothetical protein
MRFVAAVLSITLCASCGGDDDKSANADAGLADGGTGGDAALQCTGDLRSTSMIYYGTAQPSYVPLTSGQVLAIGQLAGCSATLITPSWVLTAKHCGLAAGANFCIGTSPANANTCFKVVAAINHPDQDTTLAYLGVDARSKLPAVEPIPIMTDALDSTWIGKTAEAAGYGDQEDGGFGEREFTAEPIVTVGEWLTIDGQGSRGACYGDSGGPVMVIAADNSVRVAGTLEWGADSCVGEDNYARTDVIVDWIESYTGPTQVGSGPFPCGTISAEGRCMAGGNVATWCGTDQTLQTETCSGGESCGWDGSSSGYRCIGGADSCGGVDTFGTCEGAVARWCEGGQPKSRDCGSCLQKCTFDSTTGGAGCVEDPCRGLDYQGRCNGNVAEWCENGVFMNRDCSEDNTTCEYIDMQTGYYCN